MADEGSVKESPSEFCFKCECPVLFSARDFHSNISGESEHHQLTTEI